MAARYGEVKLAAALSFVFGSLLLAETPGRKVAVLGSTKSEVNLLLQDWTRRADPLGPQTQLRYFSRGCGDRGRLQ